MRKKILISIAAVLLIAGTLLFTFRDPVKTMVSKMSLQDKITQMLMMDFRYWDESLEEGSDQTGFTEMNDSVRSILNQYRFGSVIYFAQNLTDTDQAFQLTMDLQNAAMENKGIPMLICADQEGGSVYRLATGTALPGNMALSATGNIEYARMAGEIIGSELNALGINTTLAPVVDVNSNANNPVIGLRSFGDDPQTVGTMASAVIEGMAKHNVIGCAKHFPGHGDTSTDSHYGLPIVEKTKAELLQCELNPFEIAVSQGVEMIMTAHILYPMLEPDRIISEKTGQEEMLPATMSDDIITGLLKGELGFSGIVVTDAMNMAGITDCWTPEQAVITAIQAGIDMICMPCSVHGPGQVEDLERIIQAVTDAVENGTIPQERIDDAVTRILNVKKNRGILDWNAEDYSLEQARNTVGSPEHRKTEREIASAAVTLIQNKDNTLPLKLTSDSKVLMMVPYDNEKAQMILGWNRALEAGLIPDGAEVQVVRFNAETTPDTHRELVEWADVLIFNSEISKADRLNGGRWESAYLLDTIRQAEQLGKITVVQSVDKPYDVQSYPDADAVLAVYGCKGSSLDPTEALVGGVTASENACGPNIVAGVEAILGVANPAGSLPVAVPFYENGNFSSQICYPRGYGLRYRTDETT